MDATLILPSWSVSLLVHEQRVIGSNPTCHLYPRSSRSKTGAAETSRCGSQEDADLGGDGFAARGGEVASLHGGVGDVRPDRLRHVAAVTAAPLAQLGAGAALHVGPGQRQEGDEASDELLLEDAGVEKPTWRDDRRSEPAWRDQQLQLNNAVYH